METTRRRLDSTRMRLAASPSRRSRSSRLTPSRSTTRADSSSHCHEPGGGVADPESRTGPAPPLRPRSAAWPCRSPSGTSARDRSCHRSRDRDRSGSRGPTPGPDCGWCPQLPIEPAPRMSSPSSMVSRSISSGAAVAGLALGHGVDIRVGRLLGSAPPRSRPAAASSPASRSLSLPRSVSSRHSIPSASTRPIAAAISAGVSSTDSMTLIRSSGVR